MQSRKGRECAFQVPDARHVSTRILDDASGPTGVTHELGLTAESVEPGEHSLDPSDGRLGGLVRDFRSQRAAEERADENPTGRCLFGEQVRAHDHSNHAARLAGSSEKPSP